MNPITSVISMDVSAQERLWVAVQVRPQQEQLVALHLRGKGYEEFLPTYQLVWNHSRRIRQKEFPLFPGYLFCAYSNFGETAPIVTTPGVIRILGAPGKPSFVDHNEITAIRRIVESGTPCSPSPYLSIGLKVRIVSGPLSGVTGIVGRIKNQQRLVVTVELLMRAVSVEFDTKDVVPLEASSPLQQFHAAQYESRRSPRERHN